MTIPKEFHTEFPMNSQGIFKEIPKESQRNPKEFPKHSQDFQNIQLPTLHLEAENPFGFVFFLVCLLKKKS